MMALIVGTTIKSTETSSWNKTRSEGVQFNTNFSCILHPVKEFGLKCILRTMSLVIVIIALQCMPWCTIRITKET